MLAYNQAWCLDPEEGIMKPDLYWNMWKTRMFPFSTLENGDSVLMVSGGGPKDGVVMHEGKVKHLVKEKYDSPEHAWAILSKSIPKNLRKGFTKRKFLEINEDRNVAQSGWIMAWYDSPIRRINKPRPTSLKFGQNGWGQDSRVKSVSKLGATQVSKTEDDREESKILQRTNLKPREKENLVKSRRGQGIFKSNVYLVENRCRVTGITIKQHLIASHIKPWSKSDDKEKIDGFNGLLLAPHIDHLFDKGFISFEDNGKLLISPKLSNAVLIKLGVPTSMNVGAFNANQCKYLQYHRKKTFRH